MSGRQAKAARRRADAAVDEVWARIPDAGCKGLCSHSCGPIGMSEVERDRIRRRHGVLIEDGATAPGTMNCPALVDGRCSVYADRPTICRLWGSGNPMRCPHGCAPAGGRLDDVATAEVMRASMALDGPARTVVPAGALEALAGDADGRLLLRRLLRGDWSAALPLRATLERLGAVVERSPR